jgi:hypothetical protein
LKRRQRYMCRYFLRFRFFINFESNISDGNFGRMSYRCATADWSRSA